MSTTVKGFLKGLRYISQVFEEKDQNMQIGFPTDVKHVAHIGSDGPAAHGPSWMGDFRPQELENGQVVSRGDVDNNQIGEGVGLQELLPPPEKEKVKHRKSRRRSDKVSQNGSPPRRNSSVTASDMIPRHHSRRHSRSRHRSIDSSNDPSMRRRNTITTVTDFESSYALSDGSTHSRKPRNRKLKGTGGGEVSIKKTRAKPDNSSDHSVDSCNKYVSDVD